MVRRHALASLVVAGVLAGCGRGAPPVWPTAPAGAGLSRARAFELAVRALASSLDSESPRAIVAGLPADPVCPGPHPEGRVRCHLTRPTAKVSAVRTRSGWLFIFTMPALSDHVHRARVWRRADGALGIEVESEN